MKKLHIFWQWTGLVSAGIISALEVAAAGVTADVERGAGLAHRVLFYMIHALYSTNAIYLMGNGTDIEWVAASGGANDENI